MQKSTISSVRGYNVQRSEFGAFRAQQEESDEHEHVAPDDDGGRCRALAHPVGTGILGGSYTEEQSRSKAQNISAR